MTVEIYEADSSYEEYEQVATFERGDWKQGGDHVDPDGFYDGVAEGVVLRDFDGPSLVAIDADDAVEPADEHDPDAYEKAEPVSDGAEQAQTSLAEWGGGEDP